MLDTPLQTAISLKHISPGADCADASNVRKEVFIIEQKVPADREFDLNDSLCDHIVIYDDRNPIACGRVYIEDGVGHIGRIAVKKAYRRKGYALQICDELIMIAREKGASSLLLHSQVYAVPLYEKMGFSCVGKVFMEENLPHLTMVRSL